MQYIIDFLEKEKQKAEVVTKQFPNGIKYFHKSETKHKVLHACFNPLNDEQIDKLQKDVNIAQGANRIFPEWYRRFFKTTNGLEIFFCSIYFDGEQTPLINHPIYGITEAGIGGYSDDPVERENWMAPTNLRYTNLDIFDENANNRWLRIGAYCCDGTHIVWDFKTNKIAIMYALPVTTPLRVLRKYKEPDFEKLIIAEWKDFETFFLSETERLERIFKKYVDATKISYTDLSFWRKTLPREHKDFIAD